MSKNPFGKSRNIQEPYAIYAGMGPFGRTECRVLKTYQKPENEASNQYARWFVAVKSDFTYDGYDMGDSYIREAIYGLRLIECSKEWADAYTGHLNSSTRILEK